MSQRIITITTGSSTQSRISLSACGEDQAVIVQDHDKKTFEIVFAGKKFDLDEVLKFTDDQWGMIEQSGITREQIVLLFKQKAAKEIIPTVD